MGSGGQKVETEVGSRNAEVGKNEGVEKMRRWKIGSGKRRTEGEKVGRLEVGSRNAECGR